MRIEKRCAVTEKTKSKLFHSIPNGTVFRFADVTDGPFLKVTTGAVNLSANRFCPCQNDTRFDNYVELPNAKLVTGEP